MTQDYNSPSLPVESPSLEAEMQAAMARIHEIQPGKNLIDLISTDDWLEDEGVGIEAGGECEDRELDEFDAERRQVA